MAANNQAPNQPKPKKVHTTPNILVLDPSADYEFFYINNPNEFAQRYQEQDNYIDYFGSNLDYYLNVQPEYDFWKTLLESDAEIPREKIVKNRQVLYNVIYQMLRVWNVPVQSIQSYESTGRDVWRDPFERFQIEIVLKDGPWTRENPALEQLILQDKMFQNEGKNTIYKAYPPTIILHFQDTQEGNEFHNYDVVKFMNINPSYLVPLAFVVDHIFDLYNKMENPITQKNIKNTGRNIIHRRVFRKVTEQFVGDPDFAWYISNFFTTIPRFPIHPEIKNIKSNLFQGGTRRRRRNRRSHTRKNRRSK